MQAPHYQADPTLFSLTERHILMREARTVQVFNTELTALQRQVLDLLGVSKEAFQAGRYGEIHAKSRPRCAECKISRRIVTIMSEITLDRNFHE